MIETAENTVQLAVSGICAIIAGYRAISYRKKSRLLLMLLFIIFFLGDLYWQLFLMFYHSAPLYFSSSELCWYTSYFFMYLLLRNIEEEGQQLPRNRLLWLVPVFTGSMCVFYMQRGDYFSNLVSALLMTILMQTALRGLLFLRGRTGPETNSRPLYAVVMIFCLMEYALWTSSCFWVGDTLANPYFWFDFLLTVSIFCLLPALRKAVDG